MGPASATTSARQRTVLLTGAAASLALLALAVLGGGPEAEQGPENAGREDVPVGPRSDVPDALEASKPDRIDTPPSDQSSFLAPACRSIPPCARTRWICSSWIPRGRRCSSAGGFTLAPDVLLQLRLCLVEGQDPLVDVEPSLAPIPRIGVWCARSPAG